MQIIRHELKQEGNQTTLYLYLDPSLTEFSRELGEKGSGSKEDLNRSVTSYVKSKFPNLKETTVKVMVGSMLVTTFTVTPALGLIKGDRAEAAEQTAQVTSTEAPVAFGSNFTDVNDSYKEAVDFVVSKGAQGLTETTFGVDKEIKRVDAAILLANVLGLDTASAPDAGFTDVPERGQGAVNALKAAGITNGKTPTSFGAQDNIKRGELAIWIQKGFKLTGDAELAFTDVKETYADAVEALVANKITNGISATQFGVDASAKRGDYAKFLFAADKATSITNPEEITVKNSNELQAAIDNPLVTKINLEAGNYEGQFVVDRNLILNGAGQANTTISASAELTGNRAVILVKNNANLSINNLTIDGKNRGGASLYGVKFENASGSIDKVTVTGITEGPLGGAQEFRAIDARALAGDYKLSVTNSIIENYQKSGIYVNGAGMTATVTNNKVIGSGKTEVIAQNGVTIMNGATGTVTSNTIYNHKYGETAEAKDVLFYQANAASTQSGNINESGGEIIFESAN